MDGIGGDLVPSFQLYGEPQGQGLPDLAHVETLKDRSQYHDWRIKPHRHVGLLQIMCFRTSGIAIDLDGRRLKTHAPSLLMVPPPVIHGFTFSPNVVGTVTTIPLELIDRESAGVPDEPALIYEDDVRFAQIAQVLGQLEAEYRARRHDRARALAALLQVVSVWIGRMTRDIEISGAFASELSRAEERVRIFLDRVEQSFADGLGPAEHARAMGVSKAQLARDCRALLGESPLQVIHARIVTEANRKLAYTPWTVEDIAEALGFADTGYFSRFYRQRTGETPTAYRSRIRRRMLDA